MSTGLLFVLGGARSGKSAYAEAQIRASGLQPIYVATAEAHDAEMAERIAQHRARRGAAWRTVEEPDRIEAVIEEQGGPGRAILVDCLTLWLSNLMRSDDVVEERADTLCRVAAASPGFSVLVSNEVGLGIVPETPLGRRFRDAQGRLNQKVAAAADRVVFCAAGLPLALKGNA